MENVSKLFRLNTSDLTKGIVTAIFAGVIVALAGVVQQPGFDLFTADWGSILHTVLNVGVTTFFAYMAKNFLSDSRGAVLGKVGGSTE